jgi:hypothetical protein
MLGPVVKPLRLALLVVMLGVTGFALGTGGAAEEAAKESPSKTANETAEAPPTAGESLLLLTTGRIVTGRIVRNGTHYTVQRSTGEMFVPASHVVLEAKDLRDCYKKLREQQPGKAPADEHLSLAKWCVSKQLLQEARTEALEVLKIDAARSDARDLIQKIDLILNPPPVEEAKISAEEAEKARLRVRYGVNDVESLGGLTRDQARVFMTKVHPILLNHCTNAGCHAQRSDNPFRLERLPVGEGGRKSIVTRNLEAVLERVDREFPDDSVLIAADSGPHARASKVVFPGPKGADHLRVVRDWVRSLADRPKAPTSRGEKSGSLAAKDSTRDESAVRPASAETSSESSGATRQRASRGTDSLERPVKQMSQEAANEAELVTPAVDLFDPAGFNAEAGDEQR